MRPEPLEQFVQEKGAELKAVLDQDGLPDQMKLARCAVIGLKWLVDAALKELAK
ncbi:MAG TPA: hypothetical protein VM756_15990 [Burkholderiales bacterium]|nr:hypothetical protein [Burkholderiales bacterium]